MPINKRMIYSDNGIIFSNKNEWMQPHGWMFKSSLSKKVWPKIVPYESVYKRSKKRQNHLWWWESESVCLGCGEGLLLKQGHRVSRVLSRIIEINVLYPALGGGYMGIYSNISTSLRFKQYPSNSFKCGMTAGPKATFFHWILIFAWVSIACIFQVCDASLCCVLEIYKEGPD